MEIKKALKRHGYTLTAVAKKFGITRSALSQQINNRTMTIAKLEEIAEVTGIPLRELVASDDAAPSAACPHCGKPIRLSVSVER